MGDETNKQKETGTAAAAGQQPTRRYAVVIGTDSTTGEKIPYGYLYTLIHLIKGNVGTGVFAMSEAFKESGLVLGPILMTCICLINLHCQHLLIRAAKLITERETVEVRPTFAEIVEYSYADSSSERIQKMSRVMGIVANVVLILAQYGFCCVYFVFVANHLKEVIDYNGWVQSVRVWLILTFVPMLLTTFIGNLKFLMPLSLIANVLQWTGITIIFYFTTQDLVPISDRPAVASYEDFPLFFGIALFAFSGISFLMQVRNEMRVTSDFEKSAGVLNVGTTIIIILYASLGFFGFWKYGDETKGSIFLNLPVEKALSQVTKVLLAVAVMLTFTFHTYVTFEIIYPLFYRRFGPFKRPVVAIYLFKTAVCFLTFVLANITTDIGLFISLVGAFTGSILTMILPASLELVLFKGKLTPFVLVKDFFIIILGFLALITGSIMSVRDIVKAYMSSSNATNSTH